jgi:hypothetical protein
MRLACIGLLAIAACVAAPTEAWAGHPQIRRGFWIGFGLGAGAGTDHCGQCESNHEWGAALDVRLGWALNQHVLLGTEINAWGRDVSDDTSVYLYDWLGAVTVYPMRESGFFLKAGLGAGYQDTEYRIGNTTVRSEQGPGLGFMAGTGYDIRVWRKWSITPALTYWRGRINRPVDDVLSLAELNYNVLEVSVGFTFH